jgi:hypothetical protein
MSGLNAQGGAGGPLQNVAAWLVRLERLDRRWVFLMMGLAVLVPILWIGLTGRTFPETPTPAAQAVFDQIERLPEGSQVLFSFDYDPASAGELQPMATSLLRHCAARRLKVVCIALWPLGSNMAERTIGQVIRQDFPDMREGVDFVNLGFQAGSEGLMKVTLTDLRKAFPRDARGQSTQDLPILQGVQSVRDFPLLIVVGAGYPGCKEWVQYVVTACGGSLKMVGGCTGVSAPQLYPYFPAQLSGLLGAIKGAAEYESLVNSALGGQTPPKYLEAQRRMAPQLFGHLLMVGLIVLGNLIYAAGRIRRSA